MAVSYTHLDVYKRQHQRRAHALEDLVEDVLTDFVGTEDVVIDAERNQWCHQ